MNSKILSLKLGSLCFASIIGAGFASGKEIWVYFARFGILAFPTIVLVGIGFYYLSYTFLTFGHTHSITTITQQHKSIWKKPLIGHILFVFCNILLLSAMFAGVDSLQAFIIHDPARIFSFCTALLGIFLGLFNFKNVMKINLILVPMLLIMIIVCLGISTYQPIVTPHTSFPVSALIYLTTNIYLVSFIYCKLGTRFHPAIFRQSSIIAAILFTLFGCAITLILLLNPECVSTDMPLINILGAHSTFLVKIGSIVVWLSILTSVINIIHTLSDHTRFIYKLFFACLITLISYILSSCGFTFIVSWFYPIIGVIGLIQTIKVKNST